MNEYIRSVCCVLILISAFLLEPPRTTAEEDFAISGTLIMAFANSNGIVMVTDSMQTTENKVQLAQPAQKLMKYDDRTVCAIAGLGSVKVPVLPELSTQMLGVVAAFREGEDKNKKRLSIEQRLKGIAGFLRLYVATISDVISIKYQSDAPKGYGLELMLAGYDVDGKPKVGLLQLRTEPRPSNSGKRWDFQVVRIQVTIVDRRLFYALGGMPELAIKIIANPEKYNSPAIQDLAKSKKQDAGASLTLGQLKSLGCELVRRTGKIHAEVGGECQTAVIAGGRVQEVKQSRFPEPIKPLKLSIVTDVSFGDEGNIQGLGAASFMTSPDEILLFQDSTFTKSMRPVTLDGRIFINCEFRGTAANYNGGYTVFDETNKVIDSTLEIAEYTSPTAQHLIHGFSWNTINGLPPPYHF